MKLCPPAALGDPRSEGGIFDPALLRKGRAAHRAFVEGGKDVALILRTVARAAEAIAFNDDWYREIK